MRVHKILRHFEETNHAVHRTVHCNGFQLSAPFFYCRGRSTGHEVIVKLTTHSQQLPHQNTAPAPGEPISNRTKHVAAVEAAHSPPTGGR